MKVVSVVGARPQFVKLAAMHPEIEPRHEHLVVHTGQHYDHGLSEVFFDDLKLPDPVAHLGVGSGSHGVQTGAILGGLDPVMESIRPDWVLVYGDTNSTVAAALCGVKLGLPVAHLEAGLRSFNRTMPEEHNRVATDHLADLCLAPTDLAMSHLSREGLAERSVLVGDVMTDVLFRVRDMVAARRSTSLDGDGPYVLATVHRAENTGDPSRLAAVRDALAALPLPVVLPAHPRLRASAATYGIELERGAVRLCDPLPYPDLVSAVAGARAVVTDSGGLQKEAFLLRVPCTTLRHETEWPETVRLGWNVLDGNLVDLAGTVLRPQPPPTDAEPYGDGSAARRALRALESR